MYKDSATHFGGFSLIELMVTLAVSAILMGVGVPALAKLVNNMRVLSETTELMESFSLARQYAISANQHVSVCGSSSGNSCDGGWQQGFIVYTHEGSDSDYSNPLDTPILYRYETSDTFTTEGNIKRFTFRPSGLLKGKSGSVLYCPKHGTSENYKRIVVSRGGRIRAYTPEDLKTVSHLSEMSCTS